MDQIAIDSEFDYCDPFLVTMTDEELRSRVFRPKILAQRQQIKEIAENPNIRKVFHMAAIDIFQLRNIGINVVPPYDDTMIQANIINENFKSTSLKTLAKEFLGEEIREANRLRAVIKKFKERARKEGRRFRWSELPAEYIIPYAKRDPEYTLKLQYYFSNAIKEYQQLYDFEMSLVPIVVDMVSKGLRIDRYYCARKSREYEREINRVYEEMREYVRENNIDIGVDLEEFKPRSNKQRQLLVKQMMDEGDIEEGDITRKEKTQNVVLDKKALVKLGVRNPFFKMMQQFVFFTKHKGTYYDPLLEYYTSEENDVAHFSLYQTGAKSGRFSAELVQTFPKPKQSVTGRQHEVRKVVIPRKGKAFLSKDYEQQELKLFFHYANCEAIIDVINNKYGGRPEDLYIDSAYLLFGKDFDNKKFRKPLRAVTKRNALAGIYGVGVQKLLDSTLTELYEDYEPDVIEELGVCSQWAYEVRNKFLELYPVQEYTQRKISELYKQGYIELNFDSPLMQFTRQYRVPPEKAYKGPNIEIQGTAAYVIKHAMKRVDARLRKEGWKNKHVDMVLQLHDELLFEVDDDLPFIRRVNDVLTEEMEDWVTFKIPITCSAKWSNKSWGDLVELI